MASISDILYQLNAGNQADSVTNYASSAAPGAGATIASVTLTPGVWEITAYAKLGLGGVPAAGDNDNVQLRDNTGGTNLLTLPVAAVQNGQAMPVTIRKRFTVQTTLITRAVGAATASTVYSSGIVANKLADA